MPGPQFLFFYGLLALAAIAALVFIANAGPSAPAASLSSRPDPYTVAFLRGGIRSVIWLALYALKRGGFIEMNDKGVLQSLSKLDLPSNPIEQRVLQTVGRLNEASAVVGNAKLLLALADMFKRTREQLEADGFIRSAAMRRRMWKWFLIFAFALPALSIYKIQVAVAHGRHNIGFLVMETFVSLIFLLIAASTLSAPRPTSQGRRYLDKVKLAYGSPRPGATSGLAGETLALLAVSAAGFEILAGGPDAAFASQARRAQGSGGCSSSGCSSSSCSSGGDGGGGGCGGCGGGD